MGTGEPGQYAYVTLVFPLMLIYFMYFMICQQSISFQMRVIEYWVYLLILRKKIYHRGEMIMKYL